MTWSNKEEQDFKIFVNNTFIFILYNPLNVYNSIFFLIWSQSCAAIATILKDFHHLKEKPVLLSDHRHPNSSYFSSSRQLPVCFLSLYIGLFWTFDIKGIKQGGLL